MGYHDDDKYNDDYADDYDDDYDDEEEEEDDLPSDSRSSRNPLSGGLPGRDRAGGLGSSGGSGSGPGSRVPPSGGSREDLASRLGRSTGNAPGGSSPGSSGSGYYNRPSGGGTGGPGSGSSGSGSGSGSSYGSRPGGTGSGSGGTSFSSGSGSGGSAPGDRRTFGAGSGSSGSGSSGSGSGGSGSGNFGGNRPGTGNLSGSSGSGSGGSGSGNFGGNRPGTGNLSGSSGSGSGGSGSGNFGGNRPGTGNLSGSSGSGNRGTGPFSTGSNPKDDRDSRDDKGSDKTPDKSGDKAPAAGGIGGRIGGLGGLTSRLGVGGGDKDKAPEKKDDRKDDKPADKAPAGGIGGRIGGLAGGLTSRVGGAGGDKAPDKKDDRKDDKPADKAPAGGIGGRIGGLAGGLTSRFGGAGGDKAPDKKDDKPAAGGFGATSGGPGGSAGGASGSATGGARPGAPGGFGSRPGVGSSGGPGSSPTASAGAQSPARPGGFGGSPTPTSSGAGGSAGGGTAGTAPAGSGPRFGVSFPGRKPGDSASPAGEKPATPKNAAASSAGAGAARPNPLAALTSRLPFGGGADKKAQPKQTSKTRASKIPQTATEGMSLDTKLDIAGVLLVFVSLAMLLSSLSVQQGALFGPINLWISQWFGWGAVAIPLFAFAGGVWLILRHFGDDAPTIDPIRVIGLALFYVTLLIGFQYLESFDPLYQGNFELYKLLSPKVIELGRGGGQIGWTLYDFLVTNFTEIGGAVVTVGMLVVSIMLMTGTSAAELAMIVISVWRSFQVAAQRRREARTMRQLEAQQASPLPQISVSRPGAPELAPGMTAGALPPPQPTTLPGQPAILPEAEPAFPAATLPLEERGIPIRVGGRTESTAAPGAAPAGNPFVINRPAAAAGTPPSPGTTPAAAQAATPGTGETSPVAGGGLGSRLRGAVPAAMPWSRGTTGSSDSEGNQAGGSKPTAPASAPAASAASGPAPGTTDAPAASAGGIRGMFNRRSTVAGSGESGSSPLRSPVPPPPTPGTASPAAATPPAATPTQPAAASTPSTGGTQPSFMRPMGEQTGVRPGLSPAGSTPSTPPPPASDPAETLPEDFFKPAQPKGIHSGTVSGTTPGTAPGATAGSTPGTRQTPTPFGSRPGISLPGRGESPAVPDSTRPEDALNGTPGKSDPAASATPAASGTPAATSATESSAGSTAAAAAGRLDRLNELRQGVRSTPGSMSGGTPGGPVGSTTGSPFTRPGMKRDEAEDDFDDELDDELDDDFDRDDRALRPAASRPAMSGGTGSDTGSSTGPGTGSSLLRPRPYTPGAGPSTDGGLRTTPAAPVTPAASTPAPVPAAITPNNPVVPPAPTPVAPAAQQPGQPASLGPTVAAAPKVALPQAPNTPPGVPVTPAADGPTVTASSSRQRRTYTLPEYRSLLAPGSEQDFDREALVRRARTIEETLQSFGAPGRVVEINTGPVITQFGVEPDYLQVRGGKKSRVKVSAIAQLDKDLQLALGAKSIRIEAPVPGKGYVGIEVPNDQPATVSLRDVMESKEFNRVKSPLAIALGQSVDGAPAAADLTSMPHLLIAGTTGSGKSVCVNSIIASLLLRNSPEIVKFIMVDPKRVELTGYNGIPHLIAPVVVELERIVGVLKWVTREMDERYKKFSNAGARNIEDYNRHLSPGDEIMPYIIVIIDELADLMMLAPEETERTITRIAALARATGIHLVIATQRPSVDVVTGLIKANFPARIAFAVASSVDSRVILDQPGAERLLGRGDMLYQSGDTPAPARLQGVFLSDTEINNIVRYWRSQQRDDAPQKSISALVGDDSPPEPARPAAHRAAGTMQSGSAVQVTSAPAAATRSFWENDDDDDEDDDRAAGGDDGGDEDELYEEAVDMVKRLGKASVSLLQRRLRIGYTRAARLIDLMEERGVIGPATEGSKPREVLK